MFVEGMLGSQQVHKPWFCFVAALLAATTGLHATAFDADRIQARFTLESDTEIDEGESIPFRMVDRKYFDPVTGRDHLFEADPSKVVWTFNDFYSRPDSDYGLYEIHHRFIQDSGDGEYTVRVTHQGHAVERNIKVHNLPPEVVSLTHTQPARAGEPVILQAIARDPGFADQLDYLWKLPDGTQQRGPHARWTPPEPGNYPMELWVDDGEGGWTDGDFVVEVGGEVKPGYFSVSGDIDLEDVEIEGVILAGSTRDPMNPERGGRCQIRLEMRSKSRGAGVTLTTNLDPGFMAGNYNILKTSEWGGSHSDDARAQGAFFAEFTAPRDVSHRDFGGRGVGGPFWSENGVVTIDYFDGVALALSFRARLIENIPQSYGPRTVVVEGALETLVGGIEATGVTPEMLFQGSSAETFGDAPDIRAYLCGGGSSGPFEIVSTTPEPNELNLPFLEPVVSVTFSEPVDSDSLVDNVFLEWLNHEGRLVPLRGGWEVAPSDLRTIRFIPQAYLMPGVKYCVRIDAGDEGIRSFGGATLAGSSSHGFAEELAPACENAASAGYGANTRRFAFATQVELASARLDFYQGSLVRNEVPAFASPMVLTRVYPYWQPFSLQIHPLAEVRMFAARIHYVRNRAQMAPHVVDDILRPDLFDDEARELALNSVLSHAVLAEEGVGEAMAVVQPVSRSGAVFDTVFPGAPTQLKVEAPVEYNILPIIVQGVCTPGPSQAQDECAWVGEVDPQLKGQALEAAVDTIVYLSEMLPAVVAGFGSETVSIGSDVAARMVERGMDPGSGLDLGLVEDVLDWEVQRIVPANMVIAFIPESFPMPVDGRPVLYPNGVETSVILVRIDQVNPAAVAELIVRDQGVDLCDADGQDGQEDCFVAPIQGLVYDTEERIFVNKHHAEGNTDADALRPLVARGEPNMLEHFITTDTFRKLQAPLRERYQWFQEEWSRRTLPDSQ